MDDQSVLCVCTKVDTTVRWAVVSAYGSSRARQPGFRIAADAFLSDNNDQAGNESPETGLDFAHRICSDDAAAAASCLEASTVL